MKIENSKILKCRICQKIKEGVHLKSYNLKICFDCFLKFLERRVQQTIERFKMFKREDKIAVAISGGKDSMALAKILKNLGYKIYLFHVNCQIKEKDYSKKSQEAVEKFAQKENLPLKIIDLKKEIGADLKLAAKVAKKEICAVCGMAKRYLLNREAKDFDVVATGHTVDDEAASLLASLIFWKDYLKRQFPVLKEEKTLKRRVKPLTFCFERETKLYCQILNLPYQKDPCPLRGGTYVFFKNFIHNLEKEMPSSVLNFYKGFLKRKKKMRLIEKPPRLSPCKKCGYLTISEICSFCKLKEKIKSLKSN